MKSTIIKLLEYIAKIIPLWLYQIIMKRDVLGVFYHSVSDEPMEHIRHLYPMVSVAQFEETLRYLQTRNNFVSYEELHAQYLEHAKHIEGASLPSKPVHLSFDDGFAECFTVAAPVLRKHGIPCTFFVTTNWLDNRVLPRYNKTSLAIQRFSKLTDNEQNGIVTTLHQQLGATVDSHSFISWIKSLSPSDESVLNEVCRILGIDFQSILRERQPYLTTPQVQQMHAEGFTIGAHTTTHRKLISLSDAEVEAEIVDSCQAIREITGQEIVPFAFPHSGAGLDRRFLSDIRERHPFVGLFFDTKGMRRDADFIINRVWAERVPGSRKTSLEKKPLPFPKVLHAAYQETWVEEIREMVVKARGKR